MEGECPTMYVLEFTVSDNQLEMCTCDWILSTLFHSDVTLISELLVWA